MTSLTSPTSLGPAFQCKPVASPSGPGASLAQLTSSNSGNSQQQIGGFPVKKMSGGIHIESVNGNGNNNNNGGGNLNFESTGYYGQYQSDIVTYSLDDFEKF